MTDGHIEVEMGYGNIAFPRSALTIPAVAEAVAFQTGFSRSDFEALLVHETFSRASGNCGSDSDSVCTVLAVSEPSRLVHVTNQRVADGRFGFIEAALRSANVAFDAFRGPTAAGRNLKIWYRPGLVRAKSRDVSLAGYPTIRSDVVKALCRKAQEPGHSAISVIHEIEDLIPSAGWLDDPITNYA